MEGSSDNNVSPPTSVIQGESEKTNGNGGNHTYEWIKSGSTGHKWSVSKEFLSHHDELNSEKFSPKYSSNNNNNNAKNSGSGGQVGPANGFHSLEEEVLLSVLFYVNGNVYEASSHFDELKISIWPTVRMEHTVLASKVKTED